MEENDCPNCLGTKNTFNGADFILCILCKGTGNHVIQDISDEEDLLLLNDNDFEEFDDTKNYNTDEES